VPRTNAPKNLGVIYVRVYWKNSGTKYCKALNY